MWRWPVGEGAKRKRLIRMGYPKKSLQGKGLVSESGDDDPCIAHDAGKVARDVPAGGVLDEFGALGTQFERRDQHAGRGDDPAHRNVLFVDALVEGLRVEGEDGIDRDLV